MDYKEALEKLHNHRHIKNFIRLCDETINKDKVSLQAYREMVVKMAEGVPMVEKAKNFAGAMIDAAKTGFKNVSEEIFQERFAICKSCEWYVNEKCGQCGCPINDSKSHLNKLRLASQKCPVGFWGEYNEQS